jgi:hypothetical protein
MQICPGMLHQEEIEKKKICTGYERLEAFCHHPQLGLSAKKTRIPMFGHPR